jgi:hypothetical protein
MFHVHSTENCGTEVLMAFQVVWWPASLEPLRVHLSGDVQVFVGNRKVFCSGLLFHLCKV